MRVYELSKQIGVTNKEILKLLNNLGFDVKSHISVIPPEALEQVKKELKVAKAKGASKDQAALKKPAIVKEKLEKNKEEKAKKQGKKEIELRPMTPSDLSSLLHRPVSAIILSLLKQGVVATKNQLLDVAQVRKIAELYGFEVVQPEKKVTESIQAERVIEQEGEFEERLPVVVVIGHVDHGKTTLLDYIRKTRVAVKEKGGITQHLGAYEVDKPQGSMIFLDTPGHEAFSMLRTRGVKIADIVVLVVAADDGIMPQTLEAINLAREANLPIIVALNKIDKVNAQQIDVVKQQLAANDLLPEEWGGSTVVMPISAKNGIGVEVLLDIIILQAQLLELKANMSIPAKGYILESKFEKGRGPVATVILQHGKLKIGDNFISGMVIGRVSSLVNSFGKKLKEVGPSVPVQVAGFEELPKAGDLFDVVSASEAKKQIKAKKSGMLNDIMQKASGDETILNVIVKTDNISSKEAILNLVDKLRKKLVVKVNVISSGIGDITESDVNLATETKSIIYGLHVKVQPNAYESINRYKVVVKNFDIIYKLIEDLEETAESFKPVEYESRKIGEGSVIQVFQIKNLGTIAGVRVKVGKFIKDGKLVVYRKKNKLWEGSIESLQREKKSVKEVHTGFECAIFTKSFQDWQIDDNIECYQQVPKDAK